MSAVQELISAIEGIQDWGGTYVGECIEAVEAEGIVTESMAAYVRKLEEEGKNLRARLQTAEQQLADTQKEFGRIQGTSAKQVVDRFLDLMRKLNEKDLPAGFESWEAFLKHIDGIKQRAVAAEQQLGQVREEAKRLTDALESSNMGRAVVHWMRAYDSIKASDDNDENCQILRIPKNLIPKGAKLVEAYETAKQFVIIGTPESDDESHNCDAMGCSTLSHVVARVNKSPATPSDGCGKGRGGVSQYGPFRVRIKALASELRAAGFEYSADCVAVADFDCPDWSPEEHQPPTPPHDQS